MDLLDAMDAPVTRRLGGEEVAFPLWTLADLAALGSRLKGRELDALRRECERAGVPALESACVAARAACEPFDPLVLVDYFRTVEGVREALAVSLKKSNRADADIDRMLAGVAFFALERIARDVTRMVEPEADAAAIAGRGDDDDCRTRTSDPRDDCRTRTSDPRDDCRTGTSDPRKDGRGVPIPLEPSAGS